MSIRTIGRNSPPRSKVGGSKRSKSKSKSKRTEKSSFAALFMPQNIEITLKPIQKIHINGKWRKTEDKGSKKIISQKVDLFHPDDRVKKALPNFHHLFTKLWDNRLVRTHYTELEALIKKANRLINTPPAKRNMELVDVHLTKLERYATELKDYVHHKRIITKLKKFLRQDSAGFKMAKRKVLIKYKKLAKQSEVGKRRYQLLKRSLSMLGDKDELKSEANPEGTIRVEDVHVLVAERNLLIRSVLKPFIIEVKLEQMKSKEFKDRMANGKKNLNLIKHLQESHQILVDLKNPKKRKAAFNKLIKLVGKLRESDVKDVSKRVGMDALGVLELRYPDRLIRGRKLKLRRPSRLGLMARYGNISRALGKRPKFTGVHARFKRIQLINRLDEVINRHREHLGMDRAIGARELERLSRRSSPGEVHPPVSLVRRGSWNDVELVARFVHQIYRSKMLRSAEKAAERAKALGEKEYAHLIGLLDRAWRMSPQELVKELPTVNFWCHSGATLATIDQLEKINAEVMSEKSRANRTVEVLTLGFANPSSSDIDARPHLKSARQALLNARAMMRNGIAKRNARAFAKEVSMAQYHLGQAQSMIKGLEAVVKDAGKMYQSISLGLTVLSLSAVALVTPLVTGYLATTGFTVQAKQVISQLVAATVFTSVNTAGSVMVMGEEFSVSKFTEDFVWNFAMFITFGALMRNVNAKLGIRTEAEAAKEFGRFWTQTGWEQFGLKQTYDALPWAGRMAFKYGVPEALYGGAGTAKLFGRILYTRALALGSEAVLFQGWETMKLFVQDMGITFGPRPDFDRSLGSIWSKQGLVHGLMMITLLKVHGRAMEPLTHAMGKKVGKRHLAKLMRDFRLDLKRLESGELTRGAMMELTRRQLIRQSLIEAFGGEIRADHLKRFESSTMALTAEAIQRMALGIDSNVLARDLGKVFKVEGDIDGIAKKLDAANLTLGERESLSQLLARRQLDGATRVRVSRINSILKKAGLMVKRGVVTDIESATSSKLTQAWRNMTAMEKAQAIGSALLMIGAVIAEPSFLFRPEFWITLGLGGTVLTTMGGRGKVNLDETVRMARDAVGHADKLAKLHVDIFNSENATEIITRLASEKTSDGVSLLEKVIPELRGKAEIAEGAIYHKGQTVMDHLIEAMKQMDKLISEVEGGSKKVGINIQSYKRLLRMVALFHDLGKHNDPKESKGLRQENGEKVSFIGHEAYGAELFEKMIRERINPNLPAGQKLTSREIALGKHLIDMHMRAMNFVGNGKAEVSDKAMRRYLKKLSQSDELSKMKIPAKDVVELMFMINEMDIRAGGEGRTVGTEIEALQALRKRMLAELGSDVKKSKKAPPLLTGKELIKAGVPQGPEIGKILAAIEAKRTKGEIKTKEDALEAVEEMMQAPPKNKGESEFRRRAQQLRKEMSSSDIVGASLMKYLQLLKQQSVSREDLSNEAQILMNEIKTSNLNMDVKKRYLIALMDLAVRLGRGSAEHSEMFGFMRDILKKEGKNESFVEFAWKIYSKALESSATAQDARFLVDLAKKGAQAGREIVYKALRSALMGLPKDSHVIAEVAAAMRGMIADGMNLQAEATYAFALEFVLKDLSAIIKEVKSWRGLKIYDDHLVFLGDILLKRISDNTENIVEYASALRYVLEEAPTKSLETLVQMYLRALKALPAGSPELIAELTAFSELANKYHGGRSISNEFIQGITKRITQESLKITEKFQQLNKLMMHDNPLIRTIAERAYAEWVEALSTQDSKDIAIRVAKRLRELLIEKWEKGNNYMIINYLKLLQQFPKDSPELFEELRILRSVALYMDTVTLKQVLETRLELHKGYDHNSAEYREELQSWGSDLLSLYIRSDQTTRPKLDPLFDSNFRRLSNMGAWKSALEKGAWIEHLKLSPEAASNLRGFARHNHFVNFLNHWKTLLTVLAEQSADKTKVLDAILKATNPNKWKSVKNTLKTLRRVESLERLPQMDINDFYKNLARDPQLVGDPRSYIRDSVKIRIHKHFKKQLGISGQANMMFVERDPSEPSARAEWRNAQDVFAVLQESGLLQMFARATSFMSLEGKKILANLFSELARSPVKTVNGKTIIDYQMRYERMFKLGFEKDFVDRWRKHWQQDINISKNNERTDGQLTMLNQTASQLKYYIGKARDGDLPARVRNLITQLEKGSVNHSDADQLFRIFDENLPQIRQRYGMEFGKIHSALKNLLNGLRSGVDSGKSSGQVVITGRLKEMAQHGDIPTETCQSLNRQNGPQTNENGQPLNRIRWGQIKVANYVMDGKIVARRMVEVTLDRQGRPHLLVDLEHSAGAFIRAKEFGNAIIRYAAEMGIPKDRVHLAGRMNLSNSPPPKLTGDWIYRDSWDSETLGFPEWEDFDF